MRRFICTLIVLAYGICSSSAEAAPQWTANRLGAVWRPQGTLRTTQDPQLALQTRTAPTQPGQRQLSRSKKIRRTAWNSGVASATIRTSNVVSEQPSSSASDPFRYPSSLLNAYQPEGSAEPELSPPSQLPGRSATFPLPQQRETLPVPAESPSWQEALPPTTAGGNAPAGDPSFSGPVPGDASFFDQDVAAEAGGLPGACGTAGCCGPWITGLNGLFMQRDYESNVLLSFYLTSPPSTVLSSRSVELNTMGGFEASLGRCFDNGWTVMGSYWGLFPQSNFGIVTGQPDTHLTGLQFLDYTIPGVGTADVQAMFNSAEAHRVLRDNEFHNVELNFFNGSWCANFCPPCCEPCEAPCGDGYNAVGSGGPAAPFGGCTFNWFAGLRYFRFQEFFQYAASNTAEFVGDPREVFYDIDVANNLVGLQWGGRLNYQVGCRLNLFAGTRAGVFYNYIDHRQRVYGAGGTSVINTCSFTGTSYDIESDKSDAAMLGELNAGIGYCILPCLRATVGYRVLGVSGVALAPNQIPRQLLFVPDVRSISSDGSLILHGGYAGIELAF